MDGTMTDRTSGAPSPVRRKMSPMRHDGEPDVRGYSVTHPSGTVVLPTGPEWDQLLYASTGVMTVESERGTWVIPPDRALWAPAGTTTRIVMHGRVAVRTLYLRAGLAPLPPRLLAVDVAPLLRELVLHAVAACPLDLAVPAHERLVGVLVDQLASLPQEPLQLPMPVDPRARDLALRLAADPASDESIESLARKVGAGRRTLERLFAVETGISIGRWRQRLRLVHALRLLAEGEPVTSVSSKVGYSTPSAFTAMFRKELGVPPRRYFAA
jgi:AraC-like DNA-binding protein